MPVAVMKQGELMLAHVRLTDSAFIKQCCTGREMGHLMGPNTATHELQPSNRSRPRPVGLSPFPGPPDPRTIVWRARTQYHHYHVLQYSTIAK